MKTSPDYPLIIQDYLVNQGGLLFPWQLNTDRLQPAETVFLNKFFKRGTFFEGAYVYHSTKQVWNISTFLCPAKNEQTSKKELQTKEKEL